MARIDGNIFLESITGMLGKQIVIKKRNGKAYMSTAPVRDPNKPFTPNQMAHQEKFREKMKLARKLSSDPALRKIYLAAAKAGQSACNVALQDAFSPPEITTVYTDVYKGKKGDVLLISAKDDVMVAKVNVKIFKGESLLEKGSAKLSPDKRLWQYVVREENDDLTSCRIVVKAYDLPGNETIKEITLKDAHANV